MKRSIFYDELQALADPKYRAFTCSLVPGLAPEAILGVRIPLLRSMAKRCRKETPERVEAFLMDLPHAYYDEDNLHGLLLSDQRDFDRVIADVDRFLPHVDNWATCDLLSPGVFKKQKEQLLPHIRRWMDSEHSYTLRFGMKMLMTHFLDADFKPVYLEWVAEVQHDAYYVRMMAAWFFATALAKQYDHALLFIAERRLEPWTHRKAIQKARESRVIPPERKAHLRFLK